MSGTQNHETRKSEPTQSGQIGTETLPLRISALIQRLEEFTLRIDAQEKFASSIVLSSGSSMLKSEVPYCSQTSDENKDTNMSASTDDSDDDQKENKLEGATFCSAKEIPSSEKEAYFKRKDTSMKPEVQINYSASESSKIATSINNESQNHSPPSTLRDSFTYKLMTPDTNSLLYATSGDSKIFDHLNLIDVRDVLVHAQGLLASLQYEYSQRISDFNELVISRNNLVEELDHSKTRTECLRSQVESLASESIMKDQRIMRLERELGDRNPPKTLSNSFPRILPRYSRESKCDSIPLPRFQSSLSTSISEKELCNNTELCTLHHDLSRDSDGESCTAESIFSRPRSPALTERSSIMGSPPPSEVGINHSSSIPSSPVTYSFRFQNRKPSAPPSKSFFDYFIRRPVATSKESPLHEEVSCSNCFGEDASTAWNTVGLLRVENDDLKKRIFTLEEAVDGALGLIHECG